MNIQHRTSNVEWKQKPNTELFLFLHLFKFKIWCWMLDVHFVLQHSNSLALYKILYSDFWLLKSIIHILGDIGVVRKTFRLRTIFLLQTLMPRSYFRNIIMTSGIKHLIGATQFRALWIRLFIFWMGSVWVCSVAESFWYRGEPYTRRWCSEP